MLIQHTLSLLELEEQQKISQKGQVIADQRHQLLVAAHLHLLHQELFRQEVGQEAVGMDRRWLVGLEGQAVGVVMAQERAGRVIPHPHHQVKEVLVALAAHSQALMVLAVGVGLVL